MSLPLGIADSYSRSHSNLSKRNRPPEFSGEEICILNSSPLIDSEKLNAKAAEYEAQSIISLAICMASERKLSPSRLIRGAVIHAALATLVSSAADPLERNNFSVRLGGLRNRGCPGDQLWSRDSSCRPEELYPITSFEELEFCMSKLPPTDRYQLHFTQGTRLMATLDYIPNGSVPFLGNASAIQVHWDKADKILEALYPAVASKKRRGDVRKDDA